MNTRTNLFVVSLLVQVFHGKRRRKGKSERDLCRPSSSLFHVHACSLSLLWSKLTGLNSKPVSFLVECPYSVETTRWKFLSPQFLWRKPVLEVVSHVTHMLQIVKETPVKSMIRTVKDPGYDVKTGLYRITC